MKLLVVAPYPPTAPLAGGRRRIFEQLRALSRSHEVDLACLTYGGTDSAQLSRLRVVSGRVFSVRNDSMSPASKTGVQPFLVERFWCEQLRDLIGSICQTQGYDWLMAEHCYMAPYMEGLPGRKVLTEHNIEYRIFEQLASYKGDLGRVFTLAGRPGDIFRNAAQELSQLTQFERNAWNQFDLRVVVSEPERQVMAASGGERRIHLAPNCPGFEIRPTPLTDGPPKVLFFGALNYLPNVDAVDHLINRVMPMLRRVRPDVEVMVAGRDPTREFIQHCARSNVSVRVNPVRIEHVINSSTVVVCPLRFGGGTRIKILDAMALGIPVVGTTLAVEGLGGSPGEEYFVADSADDFAEATLALLDSKSTRVAVASAAQELLKKRGNWSDIFADLEHELTEG